MNKVELLSPAGDYTCFLAAVNAGADAVYLSGEKYGARAYAKNFTKEELISAIDYAHIFNRKVYLTVNTLIKDDEMNELYDYILPFYQAGLDGVIIQDMGVIAYLRENFPGLPLHASTQLAITGVEGVNLLKDKGIVRTVLAREVSLSEIKNIHDNSDMEIECFIHGALCYSYSGKCLFSSLVGGRSGNRGRCAGSCRQPYNDDKYILSTKDICCLPIIPDLIEAGICSFKIEGRMKSPEYVAGVTSIYRKYIDLYYKNHKKHTTKEIKECIFTGADFNKDLDTLVRLYTRGGNSLGYYFKHNDKEMITLRDASYKSDKEDAKESVKQYVGKNILKIPVRARITIYPDMPLMLTLNDEIVCLGSEVQKSQNRPIDIETVKKQLLKTGDTAFEFSDIEYDIADDAFVRISELNDIRREALKMLEDELLSKYRRNIPLLNEEHKYSKVKQSINAVSRESLPKNEGKIYCDVLNDEQIDSLCREKYIAGFYIPYSLLKANDKLIDELKEYGKEVYIKFQSVIRYNYLEKNKENILAILSKADGVITDSHELLFFLHSLDYKGKIVGDVHIYSLNCLAYKEYKSLLINRLTMPIELSRDELMTRNIYGEEAIVYGYMPMMVSAQCVNNTLNGCDNSAKVLTIKDRKGAEFKAVNDCNTCINTIYNCVPLSLHNEIDNIKKLHPSSYRLCFTIEDRDRTKAVYDIFSRMIFNKEIEKNTVTATFPDNTFTKGHFKRGVL